MNLDAGAVQADDLDPDLEQLQHLQLLEDPIEDAGFRPAAHAGVDRVPATVLGGEATPRAAVDGDVEDRVKEREVVDAGVAALDGQKVLDHGELLAGELQRTSYPM